MMKAFGYEAAADRDYSSIRIKNNQDAYSFNLQNNTFTMNGKSFGLLDNPFRNINGSFYVQKHWLEAIFKLSIEEGKSEINVSL
jgi:hypothetical protein